jgi:hypothetical protein
MLLLSSRAAEADCCSIVCRRLLQQLLLAWPLPHYKFVHCPLCTSTSRWQHTVAPWLLLTERFEMTLLPQASGC